MAALKQQNPYSWHTCKDKKSENRKCRTTQNKKTLWDVDCRHYYEQTLETLGYQSTESLYKYSRMFGILYVSYMCGFKTNLKMHFFHQNYI